MLTKNTELHLNKSAVGSIIDHPRKFTAAPRQLPDRLSVIPEIETSSERCDSLLLTIHLIFINLSLIIFIRD